MKSTATRPSLAGQAHPIVLSQTSSHEPRVGTPRSRSSAKHNARRVFGPIGPMSTSTVDTVWASVVQMALQLVGSSRWPGTRHEAASSSMCTTPPAEVRAVLAEPASEVSQGWPHTSPMSRFTPSSPRTSVEAAAGCGGGAELLWGPQPSTTANINNPTGLEPCTVGMIAACLRRPKGSGEPHGPQSALGKGRPEPSLHSMFSRWAPLTAILALCATSATVHAAEQWRLDEHRPATWDDDLSQLEAAGLGQSRGNPVIPSDDEDLTAAPRTTRASSDPTVLFLNFDGAELISGPDDARSNVTTITNLSGPYPPYGENGAKRQAVMQAVREDWSAYNAVITDRRPEGGDYVMTMIGPGNPDNDSKLGIAVLDCGDTRTRNNVVFAFHSSSDSHTATSTATTISQEIGHSVGLEHVDQASDIMNPTNVGGDPAFRDECLPLSQGAECPAQHEAECENPEQQNSHRELYELMGPATPDASGPSIELIAPLDGENFETDESFEIVIDADEGVTVHKAALFVNTVLQDTDDAAPFGWTAAQSVSGEYELRVEVQDTQGYIRVSNTVTVTVGRTSPLGGADALPPSTTYGAPGEPEGCGCQSDSGTGTLPIWAVVLVIAAAGRRRRLAS